jgi:hypothetical protein
MPLRLSYTPTPNPSPQGGGGYWFVVSYRWAIGATLASSLPLVGRDKGWGSAARAPQYSWS